MRKVFFLCVTFLLFIFSKNTYAVYYYPADEQMREAIEYGEINKDTDSVTFLDEWVRGASDGYEWAALNTKFSILAFEAKQSAIESRKLTEREIKRRFIFDLKEMR